MKQTLLLLFFGLTIYGCQKKEEVQPVPRPRHYLPYSGIVTAFKNGEPWIANSFAGIRPPDSTGSASRFFIYFDRYEKYGTDSALRDYILTDYLQYQVYKTDLEGDSVWYSPTGSVLYRPTGVESIRHTNYIGSDVLDPPSSLLKTEPHWLEIATYDSTTRQVSGKFAASFVSFDGRDTFRYTDGFFAATIYDRYD